MGEFWAKSDIWRGWMKGDEEKMVMNGEKVEENFVRDRCIVRWMEFGVCWTSEASVWRKRERVKGWTWVWMNESDAALKSVSNRDFFAVKQAGREWKVYTAAHMPWCSIPERAVEFCCGLDLRVCVCLIIWVESKDSLAAVTLQPEDVVVCLYPRLCNLVTYQRLSGYIVFTSPFEIILNSQYLPRDFTDANLIRDHVWETFYRAP